MPEELKFYSAKYDRAFKEVFLKENGHKEGIEQVPRNMINMNMSIEDISKVTGLSIEEIEGLK